MTEFDQAAALKSGNAKTRDGRIVRQLQTATLPNGRTILVGTAYRLRGKWSFGQGMWWHNGGLGHGGPDDLVDA